jgi:hypothetical protein
MIDILEFIQDLERLQKLAGSSCSPAFTSTMDNILQDYRERAWLIEKDMEQQEDLFDNLPV